MGTPSITAAAALQCPHGGAVQIVSANARAKAGGAFIASATDTFLIAGCPFVVALVWSPCVQVKWVVADAAVRVNGSASVSRASTGLCLNAAGAPQGPVTVIQTQAPVASR